MKPSSESPNQIKHKNESPQFQPNEIHKITTTFGNQTTKTTQNNKQNVKMNNAKLSFANQAIFDTKSKIKKNVIQGSNTPQGASVSQNNSTNIKDKTNIQQPSSAQSNQINQNKFKPQIDIINTAKIRPGYHFELSNSGFDSIIQNQDLKQLHQRKRNPNDSISPERNNFYSKEKISNQYSQFKQNLTEKKQTSTIRESQIFNKNQVECKSLRLIGNISQMKPFNAIPQQDYTQFYQKNSYPKHNILNRSFGQNNAFFQNRNFQEGHSFFDSEKTNQQEEFHYCDKDISQIIEDCSFEQKQRALNVCSDLVEQIADKQAKMFINNISNQYGGQNPLNKEKIQEQEFCEFEPIQYQAYSQNPIPEEIHKIINQQKIEILNGQNLEQKSIVERINLFENTGSMVDGYFYTINQTESENSLYIWNVNDKSLNEQQGKWININSDRNQNFNKIRFENPIQSVCYVENHSEKFKPMLIVATSQEIQLRTFVSRPKIQNRMLDSKQFQIEREKYNLLFLDKIQFEPIILDIGEEISKIVQMKKTGKIFYSSHKNQYNQVYIKELKLPQIQNQNIQNPEQRQSIQNLIKCSKIGQSVSSLRNSFRPVNKRIHSVKAQDRSNIFVDVCKKVVPNFLNFTISKKCILDIQIDEQRNILYALTNKIKQKSVNSNRRMTDQNHYSQNWFYQSENIDIISKSVVEVYDLGILCNDFNKVCEIDQDRLFHIAMESWGLHFKKTDKVQYQKIYEQFRIVTVHPITVSQSDNQQLLITVNNGTRFFISFQQFTQKEAPFEKEIAKNELIFDQLQLLRFSKQWNVVSINFLPSLEEAISNYNSNPNPFRLLQLQKQNHINVISQGDQNSLSNEILPFIEEYLIKPRPVYCNQLNCFVYQQFQQLQNKSNQNQQIQNEEQINFLNISILSKNEPSYCYSRKINLQDFSPNFKINETYSVVQVQSLESIIEEKKEQEQLQKENKQMEILLNEFIIQISTPSRHGFLTGPIDKEMSINTQRMVGANQALKINQGWGVNNGLQYMPINEMEKQVYDAFDLQTIKILTNHRLINLVAIRPIDQLLGILEQIQTLQNGAFDLDQFNSFVMKYSIEEVCCMLIQIISEQNQSKYVSSKKFNREILENQINFKSLKLNANYNQGRVFSKQPRQMGNVQKSNINNNIAFLESHQSKSQANSEISNQRNQSSFQIRNQFQSLIDQQNDVNQLSFVYKHYSQRNNQIVSEIDNNCSYKNLTNQQLRVISIASDLFQIYGDSTRRTSHDSIVKTYKNKSFKRQNHINQEFLPISISTLFTYIQRILRPIWDMNITMTKNLNNIYEQESNIEMFYPALQKLKNVLLLLQNQNLFKQQTIEDQARILAQDLQIIDKKDVGINHKGVLSEIEFVFNFDSIIKENMDIHKNKILKNIIIFVKRCIDVIEFLKIVTIYKNNFEDQDNIFSKILNLIGKQNEGKNLLKEIHLTQYKDLVRYGGCDELILQDKNLMQSIYEQLNIQKIDSEKFKIIKALYENCLQIQIDIDNRFENQANFDYHKIYNLKAEMIQRICPTLFSANQSQTFIGECILLHSRQEKDIDKQDQILNQGIRQLKAAPLEINLDSVIPTLCEMGRMIEITELVMEKIKKLYESMEIKRNESINSSINLESQKINKSILPIDSQYEQLFECFELIVGLYRALDDHIFEINNGKIQQKKEKFIRSILDLKSQERIYNELMKHKTQEMKWYDMFYKHFSQSNFKTHGNDKKFKLRSQIIQCIQKYDDKYLLKFLFEYIVYQPRNNSKYQSLPRLDFSSFKEVYEHITSERQISKESIEILISQLWSYQNFDDKEKEQSKLFIKEEYSKMLCKFVLRLFVDSNLKITSFQKESQKLIQSFLTCEEKIKYCQQAIDSINQVELESNQQIASQYMHQMQQFLENFFFEKKVIQALEYKYDWILQYQKRVDKNSDAYKNLESNRADLLKLKNILESMNYNESELFSEIVVKYKLYDLIYEYLYQRIKEYSYQIQYEQDNQEIRKIEIQIIDFFSQNVEDIIQLSNVNSVQQISQKIKPYTWIEVFKEIFKAQNSLSRLFNNHPEICKKSYKIILQTYLYEKITDQKAKDQSSLEDDFQILTKSIKLLEKEQYKNIQEFFIVGQIIETFENKFYSKINVSEIYKEIHQIYSIQKQRIQEGGDIASFKFNRIICQMLAFIFFWTKKNFNEILKSLNSKNQNQMQRQIQEYSFIKDLKSSLLVIKKDLDEINSYYQNDNVLLLLSKDFQQVVLSFIQNFILVNIQNL